jgi:hypothetical protein
MRTFRNISILALAVLAGSTFVALAAAPDAGIHGSRASLSQPASPTKATDPDGFLRRWLLLDPITVSVSSNAVLYDNFVQTNLKREYFPNQLTVVPHDGDKVNVNGAELVWHALDTSTYNVNLYHFAVDRQKRGRGGVLFWAVTVVDSPREIPGARLSVGSNSASIWWVNEKEVVDLYADRHLMVDDGVSKRLTLKKGPNVVRCAVINGPGVSDMCARFLDAEDKPITDLTINLGDAGK